MARRTKKEAEATREGILSAALDLIFDKGYARTTFVDIANRIKLSKGAVYWHFKSKPELFLALSRQMEARIDAVLGGTPDETTSLDDLREMLVDTVLLIAEDERLRKYYTIVLMRMEWTDELLSVRAYFEQQDAFLFTWCKAVLEHAQKAGKISKIRDVALLSRALLELVNGLVAYRLYRPDEEPDMATAVVRIGLETFFTGMCTGAEVHVRDERQ